MNRRILAALLVLCSISIPALAADKWTKVQSKNFTLVGSATENEIREVAEGLEVFRTAFSRFFTQVKDGSSVATTVVVFRSDQAFKPFKPLYKGKPANIDGFFQSGEDVNYIALAADMQTPRVIYHEYVHRLMADNLASLPPWFQEGFAEAFSTLEIEGKDRKVRIGRAIAEHVAILNERQFMPLDHLFSVAQGSPEYNEESKQGLFYAESWAFVHYMMFNDAARRMQFLAFLDGLNRGQDTKEAFAAAFNADIGTFQKSFEAYIQQRSAWNAFELDTPAGLNRSKDMQARTMTEAEAEFYLGDLLLHTDRLPDSEIHLSKAVQLDPKLGSAQASMGRLLMQTKDYAKAMGCLQRATTLDPENYLAHFYYASLLHSQSTPSEADWGLMRSELQKTIQLAPQFVEATEMLANINLTRNTDMPQTVELLAKALSVSPGRDYLLLQLSYALARTDRRDNARILAKNLLAKTTLDIGIRQSAQSLLENLDRSAAVATNNRSIAERPSRAPETIVDSAAVIDVPEIRRPARPTVEATDNEPLTVRRETASLPPGTARVTGLLTLLDCKDGLTLSMVVEGKTVRLHSTNPNAIKFTSFNPAVVRQITCGAMPRNGVPASVVYRPGNTAGNLGDPLTVDFLDEETPPVAVATSMPGTSVIKGLLTTLECSAGVTISLMAEGKLLLFRTDSASKVAFLNGPNSDGTVDCGPQPGAGRPVTVVYKPMKSAGIEGEPVIVQFQR